MASSVSVYVPDDGKSPLWRSDFEADEAGELPADLKRGVLSEDGIFNVLEEYRARRKNDGGGQ